LNFLYIFLSIIIVVLLLSHKTLDS